LLVRDGGFRGTMILTHTSHGAVRLEEGLVYAEAGVASPKVARFAATHGFEGAEFLAGIPGTVGGALAMNAGCYGSETWDVVAKVTTVSRTGKTRERLPSEYEIGYRRLALRGADSGEEEWFLACWFRFRAGDRERARSGIKVLLSRRIATQPLDLPNAGSVFRNPPGDHAARLIESCGLKGYAVGGARISEKHANFIVNPKGKAHAADIEALIGRAREAVMQRFGVELIPEVRIVGDVA
jgi:UDP-N-acetylmuramate dehydrogenase